MFVIKKILQGRVSTTTIVRNPRSIWAQYRRDNGIWFGQRVYLRKHQLVRLVLRRLQKNDLQGL